MTDRDLWKRAAAAFLEQRDAAERESDSLRAKLAESEKQLSALREAAAQTASVISALSGAASALATRVKALETELAKAQLEAGRAQGDAEHWHERAVRLARGLLVGPSSEDERAHAYYLADALASGGAPMSASTWVSAAARRCARTMADRYKALLPVARGQARIPMTCPLLTALLAVAWEQGRKAAEEEHAERATRGRP